MRIALCLSGFVRNFKDTFPYLDRCLLSNLHPDIFFHGYPNKEGVDANIRDIEKLYKPKFAVFNEYSPEFLERIVSEVGLTTAGLQKFYSNKRPETKVDSLFSEYFNVYHCNELKYQYEKTNNFVYDLVLRFRMDVFFFRCLSHDEIMAGIGGALLIPHIWDFKEVSPFAAADASAFSNSAVMDTYSSLFMNIEKYYDSGCIFHHESMVGYHILQQGLNRQNCENHFWFEYPEDCHSAQKNRHAY